MPMNARVRHITLSSSQAMKLFLFSYVMSRSISLETYRSRGVVGSFRRGIVSRLPTRCERYCNVGSIEYMGAS